MSELQIRDLSHFTTCKLGDIESWMPAETKGSRRGTPMVLAGLIRTIRRRGSRGGFVSTSCWILSMRRIRIFRASALKNYSQRQK